MKIAVVGPSPMPFTIGGMEYLLWGLYEHINKDSIHSAELIKMPVDERGFWPLIESYEKFNAMNLDHFDMVVSTKYPAWMVRHENHLCYMGHRLRGLYDTYHFTGKPLQSGSDEPAVRKILEYMDGKNGTVEGVFDLLYSLKQQKGRIHPGVFEFPGPFIRSIVHFLDGQALSTKRIRRFCAISATVRDRKEYFPMGAHVDVVHPPSFLDHFESGPYDYLFTVSRLDQAKRVALMIEAMQQVKGDIRLKIAGTGPMEAELKAMAAKDDRIEFLGFVSDEEVIQYYAGARGVLFMPYEEDYGLVTIEAMMSKKPVITCTDAGGPKEFIRHGVNGFIARPDAASVAEQMKALMQLSPDQLTAMGEQAYARVHSITWPSVVHNLFDDNLKPKSKLKSVIQTPITVPRQSAPAILSGQRKRITVTSTFPIYPPKGGGQARIYHLYKNVAEKMDVEIVSFTHGADRAFSKEIAPNLRETRIPKSQAHTAKEWEIERKIGFPITDIAMAQLSKYTPEYSIALSKSLRNADLVVASHPYLLYEIRKHIGHIPLVYEAIDVEYHTKQQSLPENKAGKDLLKSVFQVEKACCVESRLIVTCSKEDHHRLSGYYGVPISKMLDVSNGVDTAETQFVGITERLALKRELGLSGEKLALFMGSWHPPNLKACERIIEFARQTPEIRYLLMGSQCIAFKDKPLPANVGLLGPVDEPTKHTVLSCVDIALNPMVSGSGTNLKMFDYMAAGIPVLTTPFGARGIDNCDLFTVAEIGAFPQAIKAVLSSDESERTVLARAYVEQNFDWTSLAIRYVEKLVELTT